MPAPSPITKPSRCASNGRDACSGASLNAVPSALAAAKPPRLTRSMAASLPPHTAMSASPLRIRRAASPIACTLAAHAVTGAPSGPLRPWRIDTCPAARLTRNDGTVNGDSRCGPGVSVVRTASAIAPKPPMPEAMTVAVRARAASSPPTIGHPAWASAWSAAPSAKGMKRSILRWSLGETTASTSQPPSGSSDKGSTRPATLAGTPSVTASGSTVMPERPASRRCQANSTLHPRGDTRPMPVMTTRRISGPLRARRALRRCGGKEGWGSWNHLAGCCPAPLRPRVDGASGRPVAGHAVTPPQKGRAFMIGAVIINTKHRFAYGRNQ